MADGIREELKAALLSIYGTLDDAAVALGMSKKTLYRYLTTKGKDRVEKVPLDFVLDASAHLSQVAHIDLDEIHRRAQLRLSVSSARQDEYGLAARKTTDETGEDLL
ncbi:hypothetical protein D9V30_00235 [Mycetocola reblochoni]|uniref:Uncharacterized protein n=2 Tax=Mycetocola reblochoni TaxID=331618 RepID=A0A3L6ZSW0_9MICO|nr:hypothetical protein D9V30_00235 [Mycetocola reblochoni]